MRQDRVSRLFNQKVNGVYLRKVDGILTYEGMYHHKLMIRSTNSKYKQHRPTYADVTVSDKFRNFQYFAGWCNEQIGFGSDGFVLEKDLLVPNNKVYTEEVCVFVPDIINSFLTFNKTTKSNGLPVGVSWSETENCYKSYCAQLNGKNKTLGRFNNKAAAYEAYCKFKESMAHRLAEEYFGKIDDRAVYALINFKVDAYVKEKV